MRGSRPQRRCSKLILSPKSTSYGRQKGTSMSSGTEMLKDLSSRRSLWGFFWYNCLRLPPIIGGNTYFWQIQNVHEVKVAVGTLGIILSIFPQRTPSLPRAYYPGNRPLRHGVLMGLQMLSICGKFQIITPGKSSQHLMRRSHG